MENKNNYEIVDDNGTLHSGTEDEMCNLFTDYVHHMETSDEIDSDYEYEGDLRLICVIAVHR